MSMNIILASDHAGFDLKEYLSAWLTKHGYTVIDIGAMKKKPQDDYPLYAREGARAVLDTPQSVGIFVCGSGVGMAITANRMKGIRASQAESVATARRARKEDNANVLVLGARIVSQKKALAFVRTFLHTPYSKAARHTRRVSLIDSF